MRWAIMDHAPSIIRFVGVGLSYGGGPDILHDIDFDLAPGSFHFVVGHSGAGKSSLLRLMYLAQRPSVGRIELFGRDLAKLPRQSLPSLRLRIGVVFQNYRLLDHLSARDNVALPLKIAAQDSTQEIDRYVAELLDRVGLAYRVDALPSTLSGGEKQRIAIARAVIARPRLLLADEPTGNVDDDMGMRLMRLFSELNRLGTTVVIATHDRDLVARFRHPSLALHDGTLMPGAPAPRSA